MRTPDSGPVVDARLPEDLWARLEAGQRRPEDLKALKRVLRERLSGHAPARWYRNTHGRQRWHLTDQDVPPGIGIWAACGRPVDLEGEGWREPPDGARACRICQKTRLATGVVPAGRLRRLRERRDHHE
jgi:hypothetical protein